MNLDNFNRWLSLFANVGVLAGIVFLVIEINQNTLTLKTQVYQTETGNLIENIGMILETPLLVSALEKMNYLDFRCTPDPTRYEQLTLQEKIVAKEYFTIHWLRFRNSIFQNEQGTLSDEEFLASTLPVISEYYPWWQIFDPINGEAAQEILRKYDVKPPEDPEHCESVN